MAQLSNSLHFDNVLSTYIFIMMKLHMFSFLATYEAVYNVLVPYLFLE